MVRRGDPANPATTLAPLSSERAAETLREQVEDAVAKGATVVIGGGRPDCAGAFFEPTILTDVTPDMRAYHEELFGPVAVVHRVADDDEAIALANDSPYGLGGSVFSEDLERARRVADRIESGMVFINHPALSRPELPFGGIKRSGYGRELADLGNDGVRQPQAGLHAGPDRADRRLRRLATEKPRARARPTAASGARPGRPGVAPAVTRRARRCSSGGIARKHGDRAARLRDEPPRRASATRLRDAPPRRASARRRRHVAQSSARGSTARGRGRRCALHIGRPWILQATGGGLPR